MWKWIAIILAGILLVGGALLFAHAVESGRFRQVKADKADRTLVVNIEPYEHVDYVVFCNEERFLDAFERFRRFVEVKTEALKAPGGPLLIALADVDLSPELRAPQRVLIEVLKRHTPKRVVLMAHQGCLIDDSIGAWLNNPTSVRRRQFAHLYQARQVILTWFPSTTVEVFYGEQIGERQLRFFPVPEDSLTSAMTYIAEAADSLNKPSK